MRQSIQAIATDNGAAGSGNITVDANVTVSATAGDVDFEAGDSIVIQSTANVTASAGNITLDSSSAAANGTVDNDGPQALNGKHFRPAMP